MKTMAVTVAIKCQSQIIGCLCSTDIKDIHQLQDCRSALGVMAAALSRSMVTGKCLFWSSATPCIVMV
jgi:hypothetical protein